MQRAGLFIALSCSEAAKRGQWRGVGAIYLGMVPNLPAVIEEVRTGCLPGREAVCVNEAMRSVRMLTADRERSGPVWSYHRHRDVARGQSRHRPGWANK